MSGSEGVWDPNTVPLAGHFYIRSCFGLPSQRPRMRDRKVTNKLTLFPAGMIFNIRVCPLHCNPLSPPPDFQLTEI